MEALFLCNRNLLNLWFHILTRSCNHLQEFNQIRKFKLKKCVNKFEDLEPWDEAYYTAMMKSTAYNLDSSVSYIFYFFLSSLSPFFFLKKIVQSCSLFTFVKQGSLALFFLPTEILIVSFSSNCQYSYGTLSFIRL